MVTSAWVALPSDWRTCSVGRSLVAVPVVYSLFDDVSIRFWRLLKRIWPEEKDEPAPEPEQTELVSQSAIK